MKKIEKKHFIELDPEASSLVLKTAWKTVSLSQSGNTWTKLHKRMLLPT